MADDQIAQDRNGRVQLMEGAWHDLLPISVREANLLRAVRLVEDLTVLNEPLDPVDVERIEQAREAALVLVRGW